MMSAKFALREEKHDVPLPARAVYSMPNFSCTLAYFESRC